MTPAEIETVFYVTKLVKKKSVIETIYEFSLQLYVKKSLA